MEQILNIIEDNDNADNYANNTETHYLQLKENQSAYEKYQANLMLVELIESIKDYTWEEKFEWVHQKKLKANRLFNKKKYDSAIQIYVQALAGIDFETTEGNKTRLRAELQNPCILNMAACMIEKNEYNKAVLLCNAAIETVNDNYVSYFRRGFAYYRLKQLEKAIEDYEMALRLCNEEVMITQIKEILEVMKNIEGSKTKQIKSLFEEGSLCIDRPLTLLSQDSSNICKGKSAEETEKILVYNDELEDLGKFGCLRYIAYPFKMGFRIIKTKICCKRNKKKIELEANTPIEFTKA